MRELQTKTCAQGHTFQKRSDCPVCPTCEKEKTDFFIKGISAPARRALENNGIFSVSELKMYTIPEIMKFHGIGKSAIPHLLAAMGELECKM